MFISALEIYECMSQVMSLFFLSLGFGIANPFQFGLMLNAPPPTLSQMTDMKRLLSSLFIYALLTAIKNNFDIATYLQLK